MADDSLVKEITERVIAETQKQILADVQDAIARFDIKSAINEQVRQHLSSSVQNMTFPQASIPATAINFKDFKFSGDVLEGGIVSKFGSTGIEDLATKIQMTVMDHALVCEQGLHTPSIAIKGNAVIDNNLTVKGDLIIDGSIPVESPAFQKLVEHSALQAVDQVKQELDGELFRKYSHYVSETINKNGLELSKIVQDGKEVISGNQLGYHIVDSNLKRVGQLTDLQTLGDTYLSETVWVAGKRLGINTMEPSATFVVWDEEVEMIICKKSKDHGYIGTSRRQNLILGSNNHDNIVLDVEGRTTIKHLRIGGNPISSEPSQPKIQSVKGHVVFNSQPAIGQPVGWVCLGESRWAEFGKIA